MHEYSNRESHYELDFASITFDTDYKHIKKYDKDLMDRPLTRLQRFDIR